MFRPLIALPFLAAGFLGCESRTSPNSLSEARSAAPSASAPASRMPALSANIPRIATTSGDIALHNLEAQMARLEVRMARLAESKDKSAELLENSVELIDLLLIRAEFLGRIADMERALLLAEEACAQSPNQAGAFYARAKARSALHRFSDALLDLDRAEKLGFRIDFIGSRRGAIWAAQGRYDEALPLLSKAALEQPSIHGLGALAVLLGEIGRHDEAFHLFEEALSLYRDSSPFPVAWIFFQRALLEERLQKPSLAQAYFEAAVQKLPLYAHAASHLATYLPNEPALEQLRRILERSDDPEHRAQLGELLGRMGRKDEAGAQLEQAKARFMQITERYPEAFADHGARFFLYRANDAQKALQLARLGAANRNTEATLDLWLTAAIAANAQNEACEAALKAQGLRYASRLFQEMSLKVREKCEP